MQNQLPFAFNATAPAPNSSHDARVISPKLAIDAAESFNYAAWQNAVPLLRAVMIDNSDGPELTAATLVMSASSGFAREKRWTIDRIRAGEQFVFQQLDLEVDPGYLDRLDEAERAVLTFSLWTHGTLVSEVTHPLRVLARDEWGGLDAMGELLPAFVTPNDPALASILKSAAKVLGENGYATALDGYQTGDPNRAYILSAALWSAVASRSLVYAIPPGSFERVGQKTRRVGTVLSDGLATCLDTSLLFAAGLEAMGLNPVLVMTQGHCFVGLWLIPKSFKRLIERDCSELRKAIAASELLVFETTFVTHQPPASFTDAINAASRAIAEENEDAFLAAIDVSRARMSQILPLASHETRNTQLSDQQASLPVELPNPPGFVRTLEPEPEERPTTPAGRIERWQRKLLDLSLRNRLLNFLPSKQTVPVLCPDVCRLEDKLADGEKLRLVSLSDGNPLGQRDADLHNRRTKKDIDWEFAKLALERNELVCPVDPKDLEARLTALYRKSRSDLAEGGSNTLFLAVGFLRWKQQATDDRSYRAPLILIPVSLVRRSASSPFYLTHHDDDVRFNATLVQLLKKDFDCDLTAFETDLPMDHSGVNVPLVFDRMRRAVRDVAGFEVIEEAAIAPFSFAKYLMWRDLVDRVGQLEHNRVVKHLIHDPDKAFSSAVSSPMPNSHEIDTRYVPQEIVHPLPADSSQLAAVMAASEGHDLVIVGPPGTGKSQTIANLITQCLAVGKTVLFVAEKTAALDVVYRRLRAHGLGDCCVELHSNKAEKRKFLDQLDRCWKNRGRETASDWITVNEKLKLRRDQLNDYVAALHTPHPNGWTAYRAMGEYVRGRDVSSPLFDWSGFVQHSKPEYSDLEECISKLAATYQALPEGTSLSHIEITEWSMTWEMEFLEVCRQLEMASESLGVAVRALLGQIDVNSVTDLAAAQVPHLHKLAVELNRPTLPPVELLLRPRLKELQTGIEERGQLLEQKTNASSALEDSLVAFHRAFTDTSPESLPEEIKRPLCNLAAELLKADLPPVELIFHAEFDLMMASLAQRADLLRQRARAQDALQARTYSIAVIENIPIDLLEHESERAFKSVWPISIWRKAKLRRRLQGYMTPGGVPDLDVDLPLLFAYKDSCRKLLDNLKSLHFTEELERLVEENPQAIDPELQRAKQIREAFDSVGLRLGDVSAVVNGTLKPAVLAARDLFIVGRQVEAIRVKLKQNLAALGISSELQTVVQNNFNSLDSYIQSAFAVREALTSLGLQDDQFPRIIEAAMRLSIEARSSIASECCSSLKRFQNAWSLYLKHAGTTPVSKTSTSIATDAKIQAQSIQAQRNVLKLWTSWLVAKKNAVQRGLGQFVKSLEAGELSPKEALNRFRLAYARWWLPHVIDRHPPLRTFQRFLHEEAIDDFCRLDELARRAAATRAQNALLHDLPPADQVPRKSELGMLRHQVSLKRPSKSIREMIIGMPDAFRKLAPCMLMSPLSIAQYLPADHALFDVVVFDEASQIPTWDAIGAIARGKQTIIVGDPKQLPPTNFFGKTDSDEENAELEDHEKDLESILDEAHASGLPTLQLNWHYRSKHESLIAFSNHFYYGNRLITFPASESIDRGVLLRKVEGGTYDRGKSRTNRREAEAIVADAVARMKRCFAKPEDQRLTYGVVTFNSQQQELIQDLFDEALRANPELEWFFSDDRIEPTVVKNLENVQGDERDVMLFSITFGFDAAGKFSVDFGALNRTGGERRLNVAITRARQALVVYSSFAPDQLRAERSNALGVHHLKSFLEYAEKGPKSIAGNIEGSVGEFESPLEEAIAVELEKKGWRIDPQVGVSGFRIDLGVIHPDKPGAYLAGIECDGATYHRSAIARDRDKTRQQILEGLGWSILRVWSTAWCYDPESSINQLHHSLEVLLENSRRTSSTAEELVAEVDSGSETSREGDGNEEMSAVESMNAKPVADL